MSGQFRISIDSPGRQEHKARADQEKEDMFGPQVLAGHCNPQIVACTGRVALQVLLGL